MLGVSTPGSLGNGAMALLVAVQFFLVLLSAIILVRFSVVFYIFFFSYFLGFEQPILGACYQYIRLFSFFINTQLTGNLFLKFLHGIPAKLA